jgi:valyl-tRNA synthetase
MLQHWPEYSEKLSFPSEETAMESVMEAISAVRTRRSEMNVPPSKKAHLTVVTEKGEVFALGEAFLKRLAYAETVTITDQAPADQKGMVSAVTADATLYMPLSELVDLEKEKARLTKDLGKKQGELKGLDAKLNNPGFLNKAPAEVVEAEKDRAEKLRSVIAKLEEQLAGME